VAAENDVNDRVGDECGIGWYEYQGAPSSVLFIRRAGESMIHFLSWANDLRRQRSIALSTITTNTTRDLSQPPSQQTLHLIDGGTGVDITAEMALFARQMAEVGSVLGKKEDTAAPQLGHRYLRADRHHLGKLRSRCQGPRQARQARFRRLERPRAHHVLHAPLARFKEGPIYEDHDNHPSAGP
jgi:hypothetical protein